MIYVTIFLLNFADLILTHIGVNLMDGEEVNPVMRPIVGSWLFVPIKLCGGLVVSYGLYHIGTSYPFWVPVKIATWAVIVLYALIVLSGTVNAVRSIKN